MYYTPKEEKIIETALYVYAYSGQNYSMLDAVDSITQMRNAVKDLLNIRNKNMSEFVENPIGALSYIGEQTGLILNYERGTHLNISNTGVDTADIRLEYDESVKKFYYHRWYEYYKSLICFNTHDIDAVIKIIKLDIERYKYECNKPWFNKVYSKNYAPAWWLL